MTHPYQSERYASAFGAGFSPIKLHSAQTFALKRPIEGTPDVDAVGIYPLASMCPDAHMHTEFDTLKNHGAVTFVWVADPFFTPPHGTLSQICDVGFAFKEHFLCDFSKPPSFSKHHTYEIRRAHKKCSVRPVALSDYMDEWLTLYNALIQKHHITGIQAFSAEYFRTISALSPITMAAFIDDKMVSAHIWLTHKTYAYSHLAASSAEGYKSGAAYAVYDASFTYFQKNGIDIINLGGGAGSTTASQGLIALKKGFSNSSTQSYLYGKILDVSRYEKLSAGKEGSFFPAYRQA